MTGAALTLLFLACGQLAPRAAEGAGTSTAVEVIVVRGARPRRPDLAPPHEVIDLEDRPLRFETLGDVMAEVPGVSLFRQGGRGASQFLSIRGADFDQTVVLMDDVPVTGPDRGAIDLSLFPVDGFSAVEVFRGSAPIRYGAGTIGGVVRLVPKEAATRQLRARASVGSFNTQEGRLEAEGWAGAFGAVASGGALRSDNDFTYLDDNATFADPTDDELVERINAGVTQGHGFFSGTYGEGAHRLAAIFFMLHQERGLPGPATVISRESEQERTRLFASLGYRLDLDVGDVPLNGFLTLALGYDHDQVQDLLGRVGLGREDTDDRYLSLDARAGVFARVLPPLTLGATVFHRRDDIRPNDRFATPGDQPSERDLTVVAAEGLIEARLSDVPVSARGSASLQLTTARLTASELQGTTVRGHDQTSPNFRLEVRVGPLEGVKLTSQLSSGSRIPTVLQLFGNRDTVVGNPDLVPETSLTADAGVILERTFGPVDVGSELRLFYLRVEDIIVARRTAQNTVAFRNERSGATRGVEAALSVGLDAGLFTTLSLTYLDSEFDNSGFLREQPLRVPWRYFQRIRWQTPLSGLELWSEVDHRSSFFADSANQVEQAPLTFMNLGLRAHSEADGLSLAVSMMNLFDQQGLDLLAFPRPGRAFEIALEWKESTR